eukprot:723155-Amorphochlora_amoeboformis.AAC.1
MLYHRPQNQTMLYHRPQKQQCSTTDHRTNNALPQTTETTMLYQRPQNQTMLYHRTKQCSTTGPNNVQTMFYPCYAPSRYAKIAYI